MARIGESQIVILIGIQGIWRVSGLLNFLFLFFSMISEFVLGYLLLTPWKPDFLTFLQTGTPTDTHSFRNSMLQATRSTTRVDFFNTFRNVEKWQDLLRFICLHQLTQARIRNSRIG